MRAQKRFRNAKGLSKAAGTNESCKRALFIRGRKTSSFIISVLKELFVLSKPHGVLFSRKNEVNVFENTSNLEFLCKKNNAGSFAFATHTKKRPHNLTLGRVFDSKILDAIELGILAFVPMDNFKQKIMPGGKPCFIFIGREFEEDHMYAEVKNTLLDVFRGDVVDRINLAGLDRVIVCTVLEKTDGEKSLHLMCYTTSYHQTRSPLPRIELLPTGPKVEFAVRRTLHASDLLKRQAYANLSGTSNRRRKNVSVDTVSGEKVGRIHVEKQDLEKIQTRRIKGLKRKPNSERL